MTESVLKVFNGFVFVCWIGCVALWIKRGCRMPRWVHSSRWHIPRVARSRRDGRVPHMAACFESHDPWLRPAFAGHGILANGAPE